ncbi:putative signal transducing protein [Eionea flava]
MRLLYEAQNSIEAHMIRHLLEQEGLSVQIDGEYLQGGVGEIQASGIVRIMIAESDYLEGKRIVEKWDERQRESNSPPPANYRRKSSFLVILTAFLCGIILTVAYYYTPITEDGIDYNDDGVLDETWTYFNNRISKSEVDRNFDGKVDYKLLFDRKGFVKSFSSDEDFNGVFETQAHYEKGNVVWVKSDTTGDGFKNYRENYRYGIIETVIFFKPGSTKALKIQRYNSKGMLVRAEVDIDGDGLRETVYQYNDIEEIISKTVK